MGLAVTVTVRCQDPGGLFGEKEFTVNVTNTPDPPSIAEWSPRTDPTIAEGESITFSVDRVRDPDGPSVVLHFSFRVKGPKDTTAMEVQNTTSHLYSLATDYESEGRYTVVVVVFDEDLMSSVNPLDWTVTVTKSNRPPEVSIEVPLDGDVFGEGKWVDFRANASDPDVEDRGGLVIEWYEGEQLLGTGRTLSLRNLESGEHLVSVVVTDPGGESSEGTVAFTVSRSEAEPGFGWGVTILALSALCAVMAARGRRGRDGTRVPKW